MPVFFDFFELGPANTTAGTAVGPVTHTYPETFAFVQTVTFTISPNVAGGFESFGFPNAAVSDAVIFGDGGSGGTAGNDIWTMRFTETGAPTNTVLSGTTLNPVALEIGAFSTSFFGELYTKVTFQACPDCEGGLY